jgi:peptidoglycan/xylan/chitin deacetylase (PgdA/CDA1 family)
MASAAAGAVTITAPHEGAFVTRTVTVKADTTGLVTQVTFEWSKDGGATWEPIGTDATSGDGWKVKWKTNGYSGRAEVRATANDPVTPSSDTVRVTVDNRPPTVSLKIERPAFSPNDDGRKDGERIVLTSNEPSALRLLLLGPSGQIRRKWHAKDTRRLVIRWHGRAAGAVLPDNRYRLRGRAVDRVGQTGAAHADTIIDTRAPRIRWHALGPSVQDGIHKERFRFRTSDRSRRVHARIEIFDDTGLVGRTRIQPREEGRASIPWRPRYRDGAALTPGLFRGRVDVIDDAGNERVSGRKGWRVYRSVKAKPWFRVENAGDKVALTFDDCLEPDAWSRLLTTLRSAGVHATFFCPGEYVLKSPDLARRTVREGNAIGAHAWDHALLTGRSAYQTTWRIKKDRQAWWRTARTTPVPLFRPPYGAYDREVLKGAGAASYRRVILWDVDPQDWRRPAPSVIASNVLSHVRAGSIVVMHVLDHTASALPRILEGLKQKGLTPVTLPRLFRAGGMR